MQDLALLLLPFLLHSLSAYTWQSYPNWLLDAHACNINSFKSSSGWLCDPHALLTLEERDLLDAHATSVRKNTPCRCIPATMCHPSGHGTSIALALMRLSRRQSQSDYTPPSVAFRAPGEPLTFIFNGSRKEDVIVKKE